MKEVIRYQSDSGNVYDTKEEALRDDEQAVIEQEIYNLVGLDSQDCRLVASYIMTHYIRMEKCYE